MRSGYWMTLAALGVCLSISSVVLADEDSGAEYEALRYGCTVRPAADLSGDCQVDFFDYALFATAWVYGTPEANLYIDETLDIMDATAFAEDWLVCGREPADECWSE